MLVAASMADVLVMKEIEDKDKALTLGIDLSTIDLDSIHLPPGEDYGIFSDDEEVYKEKLSMKKQLKLKCQEEQNLIPDQNQVMVGY